MSCPLFPLTFFFDPSLFHTPAGWSFVASGAAVEIIKQEWSALIRDISAERSAVIKVDVFRDQRI